MSAARPERPELGPQARPELGRRALAEFIGTGLLVAVVVGSGIMAVGLSPGAAGL